MSKDKLKVYYEKNNRCAYVQVCGSETGLRMNSFREKCVCKALKVVSVRWKEGEKACEAGRHGLGGAVAGGLVGA